MFDTHIAQFFWKAFVALTLGAFIGLERERSSHEDGKRSFAGARTFPLCALLGFICAHLNSVPLLVAGFAATSVVAVTAYWKGTTEKNPGVTSEVAFILTYLLGAMSGKGLVLEAAVVALVVTMLLVVKERVHGFARTLSEKDLGSALKFGVISIIVLPLVPDRAWGPWGGVNPHKVWLMVVLMSGIGFAGYILTKLIGPRAGTGLAGLVGGLVSSTAVTLTFSKRSRETPSLSRACALAIVGACTVLYVRVFIEALVVNRDFAKSLAMPAMGLFLLSLGLTLILYRTSGDSSEKNEAPDFKNPVELLPAIKFALVFAGVTLLFNIMKEHFGDRGTYIAAFLSGLTDMDAVTLSMAEATKHGTPHGLAVTSVLIAAAANTLVKAGFALALGSPALRKWVGMALGITCAATVAAIFLFRLKG